MSFNENSILGKKQKKEDCDELVGTFRDTYNKNQESGKSNLMENSLNQQKLDFTSEQSQKN